ncbi:unnamed protein product [marine sediment metagenome]|uniref:Uncharacterized protein n=2 Tax=marine sediment metagenome TaxID=412755 RepID=X1IXZ2_9ZZZZ
MNFVKKNRAEAYSGGSGAGLIRYSECNFNCVNLCPFGVFSYNYSGVVEVSKPYEYNVRDESCKFIKNKWNY